MTTIEALINDAIPHIAMMTVIIGIVVELLKPLIADVDNQYYPHITLVVGAVIGLVIGLMTGDIAIYTVAGILSALSASGLYDNVKSLGNKGASKR